MKYFNSLLKFELYKVVKSRVILLVTLAFTIAPLMATFLMYILKNPDLANNNQLISSKAHIIGGDASWSALLSLQGQIIAVGGIFVYGFIISWIFGREFVDGTIKDLVVLPYRNSLIVTAKFLIAFLTSFLLTCYITILSFLGGTLIKLPEFSLVAFQQGLKIILIVTIFGIVINTPVGFIASYSRGYLAPLGLVIIVLILSQILTIVGYGNYFPWSIPALLSGFEPEGQKVTFGNSLIIILTAILGFLSTILWWEKADY